MKSEQSLAFRLAVLVAVVTSATAVLRQGVGGPLLYVGVFAGIPAGFAYSHVARDRDDLWPKVLVAAGVLLVLFHFTTTVGGMRSAAEVQVPLAELFVWVQVLHAVDVPARRNLLVGLLASLVLTAVAGVLSVSLEYAALLAVWAAAAGTAIVLAHRSLLAELPALGPASRSGRPPLLAVPATLLAALAAFALLPAAGSARALTFPMTIPDAVPTGGLPGAVANPTLGGNGSNGTGSGSTTRATFAYTGFSNELDTSARGRPDNTLVMRVRASAPALWRGQSFDRWDGRRWTATPERPVPIGDGTPTELTAERAPGAERFVQTFYLTQPGPNIVFGAYPMTELYFPDPRVFILSDGTVRTGVRLDEKTAYTVVSHRPRATAELLRAAEAPPPLDDGTPTTPRVRALAADITAAAPTTYDKVQALIAWMGANTRYTLDIPPLSPGVDAVDNFLFEERRGFCEQIGSALVVMLRSLGVRARLAVGYAAGERNPFTGLFEVHASDAHAWAEVYFPGVGWQGFDPTATVPLAGEGGLRAASGLTTFVTARLPSVPAPLFPALAMTATVVVVVRRRRRHALAPPKTWTARWQALADDVGRAAGRPRREGETMREYVQVLSYLAPHPGWRQALRVVEEEAYGGVPASAEQRARAMAVLSEAR